MDEVARAVRPGLLRRIVAYPLTLAVLGTVWLLVCYAGAGFAAKKIFPKPDTPLVVPAALILAAVGIAGYFAFKRWIERAPAPELSPDRAGRELVAGLALGFAIFSAAVALVALLGGFEVLGLRGIGALWEMLAVAILSGVFEELLFRGILLRHLETLIGPWLALAVTSALFGAAHLANPDSSWFAAFAIAVEAGVLLGAAYFLTRRLWLAIGIHAGWNFTQGWVYSIPVSGGPAPLGLLITRRVGPDWVTGGDFGLGASGPAMVGPDWVTGGDFGLEASVPAMVVATLAGCALLYLAFGRARRAA